jgi:hypothetical protein
MRKLGTILLALVVIAGLGFSEIKFTGGWGDYEFRAAQSIGGAALSTSVANPWNGYGSAGLTLQAKGDKGGLYLAPAYASGDNTYSLDSNYIWMLPVDGLKVIIGQKVATGTLRVHSSDAIFTQLNTANAPGLVLEFTKVQNLYLGASVKSVLAGWGGTSSAIADTYASAQVAFDYTVAGFGRIRAQYIGDGVATGTNNGTAEVAVLTSGLVQGLTAELGVKAPLVTGASYNANIYAAYSAGALGTEFWIQNTINTATGATPYGLFVSAEGWYNISGPYTAGLYAGYTLNGSTEVKPYFQIQHGLENGFIKGRFYFDASIPATGDLTWRLPVYLEYCFW